MKSHPRRLPPHGVSCFYESWHTTNVLASANPENRIFSHRSFKPVPRLFSLLLQTLFPVYNSALFTDPPVFGRQLGPDSERATGLKFCRLVFVQLLALLLVYYYITFWAAREQNRSHLHITPQLIRCAQCINMVTDYLF